MLRNLFASLIIFLGSVLPSYALDAADGFYFYRYKSAFYVDNGSGTIDPDDPSKNKDITAYFVGGVGTEFEEKIPLKPIWEDDNWVITAGDLPSGITYDSANLKFVGTPSQATNKMVDMVGYDKAGNAVATARIYFNIYVLPPNSVKLDLYAHTGKFFVNTPEVPAGVEVCTKCWSTITPIPPGLTIIGHNIDGIPTKAGIYPILIQGHDYNGKANIAYVGKITVEDAPQFPIIKDQLSKLVPNMGYLPFMWGFPKAKRTVGKDQDIVYGYEIKDSGHLPGTVKQIGFPSAPLLGGDIFNTYEQAKIRLSVTDTDGTKGYSNWFTIGSLGGQEVCTYPNGGTITIGLKAGIETNYSIPVKGAGVSYTLRGGALPDGLSFDGVGGVISGTPVNVGISDGYYVDVAYQNKPELDITCGPYRIDVSVKNPVMAVTDKEVYRTNDVVSGEIVLDSSVALPAMVEIASGSQLPAGLTFNSVTRKVTGTVSQPGVYDTNFLVTAANGATYVATMKIPVLMPLSIQNIPDPLNISRYASLPEIQKLVIDSTTVWKSATLRVVGTFPNSVEIDQVNQAISGGTADDVGTYGPYRIRVTDESGASADSNSFHIVVGQRAPLQISSTQPADFVVNQVRSLRPVVVAAPPKGTALTLTYSLNKAPPAGLIYESGNGVLHGVPVLNGEFGGYIVTVTDNEGATVSSEPFTIKVADPADPQSLGLGDLFGNVGHSFASQVIKFIPDTLVGGVEAVTYESMSPQVPGLALDTATGIITGTPTSEFDGDISVAFKDGAGRSGLAKGHLTVLPSPAIQMTANSYDLPRLASATNYNIKATDNGGFYGNVVWTLAPDSAPLPLGLSVYGNKIVGSTSSSERTVSGLKLKATDSLSGLSAVTQPFSIKVVPRIALTLAPTPNMAKSFINGAGVEVARMLFASVKPSGSYIGPLVYSIVNQAELPPSLTINPSTGQFQTFPNYVGTWPVTLKVTDAENNTATASVFARTTLDGFIQLDPQLVDRKIRVNERFATTPPALTNQVPDVTFSTLANDLPPGVTLDEQNGSLIGSLSQPGTLKTTVKAVDAHDRTSNPQYPLTIQLAAQPDLGMASVGTLAATQFSSAQKLNVTFPRVTNAIGDVSYLISGNAPGTLVYKMYAGNDPAGAQSYWQETNGALAPVTGPLPNDALVFDTLARTLIGIPSQAGSFEMAVVASDDHKDHYDDPSDPGRISANVASGPFTVNVAPAAALQLAQNKSTDVINVLTKQPSVTVTADNVAYGKLTWTKVSGTLPPGVTAVGSNEGLTFVGYPTTLGTYGNIVYRATDGAGRVANTSAITFDVQPRLPLALVASSNPKGMIVNTATSPLIVTPQNAARGEAVSYNVSGDVPAGITYQQVNGSLVFSGTPTLLGNFDSIQVSATDTSGQTVNLTLSIKVIAPNSPIILNVYDVKTKVGHPYRMATPYAANVLSTENSYGTLNFVSANMPAGKGLSINPDTGELVGTATVVGDIEFDMRVTDETNRLTSKSVLVQVIPNLQVTYPTEIITRQGAGVSTLASTQYKIGNVTYTKGPGTWPEGLTVNAVTGTISGMPTSPVGIYPDLTVIGTDASGDSQPSNKFQIEVKPSLANANIANVNASNKFLIDAGVAFSFTPTVTDSVYNGAWAYGGLTFAINKALPAGLTFNTKTGAITGTPTEAAITDGFVITVTNEMGVSTSTAPFQFVIRPAGDMEMVSNNWYYFPNGGGRSVFWNTYQGQTYVVPPPTIINGYGRLKFSTIIKSADFATLDPDTGAVTLTVPLNALPAEAGTRYYHTIVATDEFGRGVSWRYDYGVAGIPQISYPDSSLVINAGSTITPVTSSASGGTFSISPALPAGLSMDASTGVISGIPTAGMSPTTYTVTVSMSAGPAVSDDFVLEVVTSSVNAARYWKFVCNTVTTVPGSTNTYQIALAEMRMFQSGVDVTDQATYVDGNSYSGQYTAAYAKDGSYSNVGWATEYTSNPSDPRFWIKATFPTARAIDRIDLYKYFQGIYQSDGSICSSWTIMNSQNDVSYVPVWSDSHTGWAATGGKYITRP